MDIGIFTDTWFPQVNGVVYTIELWRQKLPADHTMKVYYPSADYQPKENEFGFPSVEFRFYRGYRIAFPFGIYGKAKDLDVVHIHGLYSMAFAGKYVAKRARIPHVLTFHTPGDEYINYLTKNKRLQEKLKKAYNIYERKLLNSADYVTCPSEIIRDRLAEKGIENVHAMSNGLDTDFFRHADPAKFKEKYQIPDGKVIGFCGRFGFEKHLEDLITFADSFDGQVILAGKGPAEEHYKKLAAGKENVKVLGFLERHELPMLYSAMDVFVFPSTAETQGLVALESMACGTPVVGADALALKETITDGKTGYHYTQGDLAELKEKVHKAYDNRLELSRNGVEFAQTHSVKNTIENLLRIYASL